MGLIKGIVEVGEGCGWYDKELAVLRKAYCCPTKVTKGEGLWAR